MLLRNEIAMAARSMGNAKPDCTCVAPERRNRAKVKAVVSGRFKEFFMPLILLGILFAVPLLDIYATLRLAEALGVPGLAMFIPGMIAGALLMKRETQTLKSRFVGAVQTMGVHGMVFDSGRRMLAAVLLLLPGFISDLFAVFLLLMPNRSLISASVAANAGAAHSGASPSSPSSVQTGNVNANATVVDGEFRRVE
jgi:UPF0716 protein FxsA